MKTLLYLLAYTVRIIGLTIMTLLGIGAAFLFVGFACVVYDDPQMKPALCGGCLVVAVALCVCAWTWANEHLEKS